MKLAILGASGRTGRLLTERALAAGHQVRVLVRTAAKLSLQHPHLEVRVGDSTDRASVQGLVDGCDAVISAVGPVPGRVDVCSVTAGQVIAAGAKRYVAISGAGIDVPGDDKDLVGKLVSRLVRLFSPGVFADKVREHALLEASAIGWTLVRPPRLVDRPASGKISSSLTRAPGSSISRGDLAEFVLSAVSNDGLIRKAPFVSS